MFIAAFFQGEMRSSMETTLRLNTGHIQVQDVDYDPDKLKKILDLTNGRGVDKSVETSSADTAPAFLVEATRRRGLKLPRGKRVSLAVVAGAGNGNLYRLDRPRVVLGRAGAGATIEIDDPEVSRSHAALESIRKQVEAHTTVREKVSTSVDLPPPAGTQYYSVVVVDPRGNKSSF